MFGKTHSIQTMSLAADMKLKHMPDLLYKYRSFNNKTLDALKNDYLVSSPANEFNDALEGLTIINRIEVSKGINQKCYDDLRKDNPTLPESIIETRRDLLTSFAKGVGHTYDEICKDIPLLPIMSELDELVENRFYELLKVQCENSYNLCCFSSEYDGELMWAHYADGSRGFCAGYDIKSLNNDLTHLTLPVIYKEDSSIKICNMEDINGSTNMYALTLKGTIWSYEKEWRIFFRFSPELSKEKMPTPKVIYVGSKASLQNTHMLIPICKEKRISLYKMNVDSVTRKITPLELYIPD